MRVGSARVATEVNQQAGKSASLGVRLRSVWTDLVPTKNREETMRCRAQLLVPMYTALGLLLASAPVLAADLEIDRLLQSPVSKD